MICKHSENYVIDSRPHAIGIRRRRACAVCDFRWNTYEITEAELDRLHRLEARVAALFSEMVEAGDSA